jgi:hypothetical protein
MRDAPTGLIRWTPIAGATAYEVWYTEIGVKFRTLTNVADEREFWTLHPSAASTIRWRVRAIRYVSNASLPNTLPVVSYGPYSPVYTTTNLTTTAANAPIKGNTVSGTSSGSSNQLMAGFSWTGNKLASHIAYPNGLWRVYIFSDKSCVNSVTVGSIVGGAAWAPRWAQPMALPVTGVDLDTFAKGGSPYNYAAQANVWAFDLTPIETAEAAIGTAASTQGTAPSSGTTDSASTPTTTAASTATPTELASVPPGTVELPDNSAYWWTAIPVEIFEDAGGNITYQDMRAVLRAVLAAARDHLEPGAGRTDLRDPALAAAGAVLEDGDHPDRSRPVGHAQLDEEEPRHLVLPRARRERQPRRYGDQAALVDRQDPDQRRPVPDRQEEVAGAVARTASS